jgi:hypothetical protein
MDGSAGATTVPAITVRLLTSNKVALVANPSVLISSRIFFANGYFPVRNQLSMLNVLINFWFKKSNIKNAGPGKKLPTWGFIRII